MKRADQQLFAFAFAFIFAAALFTPIFGDVAAHAAGVQLAQTVDFSPLANNAITAAITVLTIAAGVVSKFAVSFLASKTRLTDSTFEKLMADRVNDILMRAIDHADMWMKAQVADPQSSIREVRIDNMFIRIAVEYALRSMPDLIKYFGLTQQRIEDMIKARLNSFTDTPTVNSGIVPTAA